MLNRNRSRAIPIRKPHKSSASEDRRNPYPSPMSRQLPGTDLRRDKEIRELYAAADLFASELFLAGGYVASSIPHFVT